MIESTILRIVSANQLGLLLQRYRDGAVDSVLIGLVLDRILLTTALPDNSMPENILQRLRNCGCDGYLLLEKEGFGNNTCIVISGDISEMNVSARFGQSGRVIV